MASLLFGVLTVWASSAIARLLIGGGITIVVASGIGATLGSLLDSATSELSALPSVAFNLIALAGFGDAVSIVGSAILTRAALITASNFMGVKIS